MSSLIVEVVKIDDVSNHPNADRMKIATIKGWKSCVGYDPETQKAEFAVGDKAVYFPPDCVLSDELAERLKVTNYCSSLKKEPDGTTPPGKRVKAARLRGFSSYGFVTTLEKAGLSPDLAPGANVADDLGVTKYVPQIRDAGEQEPDHPAFHSYTSVENIGNFPDLIPEGIDVVVTEKIHGSQTKVGLINNGNEWIWMCGSNSIRRKEFNAKGGRSLYWHALNAKMKEMINWLRLMYYPKGGPVSNGVMVFLETFGLGVQDLHYGQKGLAFRVFDIAVDGRYLDWDSVTSICKQFGIETVPVLYEGPFSREKIAELTDGRTMIAELPADKEQFTGREGIVVKTLKERISTITNKRMILKSVSADYLDRRNAQDDE